MKFSKRIQYIPRNMHTVFALLCFVVVIHWLIFPYPSGLLHWHCGNLSIAPVPAKQPWWIWINTSCEFIMNDCITTTKQSTTKPCAYFLGYTVSNYISNDNLKKFIWCHVISIPHPTLNPPYPNESHIYCRPSLTEPWFNIKYRIHSKHCSLNPTTRFPLMVSLHVILKLSSG